MSKPFPKAASLPSAQRVKKMNCHAGVVVNGMAVSSLHYKDHSCAMQVTPYGVHVVLEATLRRPAAEILVPFSNIYFIELMGDDSGEA